MVGFRRATALALVFSFFVIVLGAAVRVTGSGLACPDWPLCYGLWFPTPGKLAQIPGVAYTFGQVMLEWVHRLLVGGIVGPLVLALLIWAWRLRRERPSLLRFTVIAFGLLLVQAGIGGFTVFDRNSPSSVAVHLTVAMIFFSVLILIFLISGGATRPDRLSANMQRRCGATALVTLVTLTSGAVMAASGASLACDNWPWCGDTLVPDFEADVLLNLLHRVLALGTVVMIGALSIRGFAHRAEAPRFFYGVAGAFVLVLIEAALGAFVVLQSVPLLGAVIHQALAVLVFSWLMAVYWRPTANAYAGKA